MLSEIKKAIIPVAGLGTRFLPLSRAVPKEFLPLVDKPAIQYIVEEACDSKIEEIIFITPPRKKRVLEYFKPDPELKQVLKKRGKKSILRNLKKVEELSEKIKFRSTAQSKPLGDGHAVFQARKMVGKSPVGVFFCDDIVDSEVPCFLQLNKVFKTCQKPILALKRVEEEKVPSYGVVGVQKIANRLYKIKKIVEKPSLKEAPTNLAIVGRYILTPKVFEYLKSKKASPTKELRLSNAFSEMLEDGKMIYGYEIKGKWLECGNRKNWLKSNFYLCLKHPELGPELKQIFKKLK